jgi:hypothetical protein
MGVYQHVPDELQREAATRIGALLEPPEAAV